MPDLIEQRTTALTKLSSNPKDFDAMKLVREAQEKINAWARSQQKIGAYTGNTGVKPLTYEQLSSGPQAWARKVRSSLVLNYCCELSVVPLVLVLLLLCMESCQLKAVKAHHEMEHRIQDCPLSECSN